MIIRTYKEASVVAGLILLLAVGMCFLIIMTDKIVMMNRQAPFRPIVMETIRVNKAEGTVKVERRFLETEVSPKPILTLEPIIIRSMEEEGP